MAKGKRKVRSWRRRFLRACFGLTLLSGLLGLGTLGAGYLYFSRDLPDFHSLEEWRPPQTTRIHAADGTVLAELFRERRTVVPRDRISELVVQAILSAEDADFYRHEGLDYTGMARALYNSVKAGRLTGSGSTITQQTVKNLVLSPERTFERKAREIILARRIESRLSKDDILTLYLNAIYWGHGRYGVQEAARFYWDKDAADLSLPQAAALAGIIQSPERLSPRKHPKRTKARRRFVLKEMAENGFITSAERDAAEGAPLALAKPPEARRAPWVEDATWFVEVVRRQLVEALGEDVVLTGGLRVSTTLDSARQQAAAKAVRVGLRALDSRQRFGRPEGKVDNVARWRKQRARALGDSPPLGKVVPARVESIDATALLLDLGVGRARVPRAEAARFARDGELPFAPGDLLTVRVRADGPRPPETMHAHLASAPQGALVVLDPRSHDVRALVGGYDHSSAFDRATQARRQVGSAFKPFVWGAAYETRRFTPATVMVDAPETWPIRPGKWWRPKNYTGKYRGPLPLADALAHSVNSVAVRLADEVGVPAVHAFARRAGLQGALVDNLTVALASSDATPLELAGAYATIATGGQRSRPRFVVGVDSPHGPIATSLVEEPAIEQAIPPDLAFLVRDSMRTVVTRGSGRRLKRFPRPVAGKTGTSNEARDTWFVALLPNVVAVAWVGFDTPRPLGKKEAGSRTALPLVRRYLEAAEQEGPGWPDAPEGVVSRLVDPPTGKLAAPGAEGALEVNFLEGSEPTEHALAPDELDADTFVLRQLGAPPEVPPTGSGPSLRVPHVGVSPLPEELRPLTGVDVEPAAPPREPEALDRHDVPEDLMPLAPVPAGDPEDAPP